MCTLGIVLKSIKKRTGFIVVQGRYDSPHSNDHILVSSVKILGSGGKKTLGGIDGSSADMGLLAS